MTSGTAPGRAGCVIACIEPGYLNKNEQLQWMKANPTDITALVFAGIR